MGGSLSGFPARCFPVKRAQEHARRRWPGAGRVVLAPGVLGVTWTTFVPFHKFSLSLRIKRRKANRIKKILTINSG